MWQFQRIEYAAFKHAVHSNMQATDKIALGQRYDFPRADLLEVYLEICSRKGPLSVEEGGKIGHKTLALIPCTHQVLGVYENLSHDWKIKIITNNLIGLNTPGWIR